MIRKPEEFTKEIRKNARGGNGEVTFAAIWKPNSEMKSHTRMYTKLILEPGCSIGKHVHENEEEVFYVIQGVATYDDDGTIVKMYPGDGCICRNGQEHSIANREESGTLTVVAVILTL